MKEPTPDDIIAELLAEIRLLRESIQESNRIASKRQSNVCVTPAQVEDRGSSQLSFTLREAAEMLGVSYITAYRLVQRGKLKSVGGLRTKLISKQEIERFLRS